MGLRLQLFLWFHGGRCSHPFLEFQSSNYDFMDHHRRHWLREKLSDGLAR